MPVPRVFVSSTAYDLGLVRGQLRSFIYELGFDPVLSEYSDVLFDPRTHTHLSCVKEVPGCDLLVLVVGSRFGSEAVPEAVLDLKLEALQKESTKPELVVDPERALSVTQLEVLKAIEARLPVFAFVDERVLQDHATYEANRDAEFIEKMQFASISQPESARYIFGFIDFLRSRVANNAIFPFSKIEDIESHLRKQWGALFQRLLEEEREQNREQQRIDRLSEQFDDLKAAILTTVEDAPTRDVARGVLNFRFLVDAVRSLPIVELRRLVEEGVGWDSVMEEAGVLWPEGLVVIPDDREFRERALLERRSAAPLVSRMSAVRIRRLPQEWEQFVALPVPSRLAIYDALSEARTLGPPIFREYSPPSDDPSGDDES